MSDAHIPLDEFSLRWRWLEEGHHPLSPPDLARIRPYGDARANEVWARSIEFSGSSSEFVPDPERFLAPDVLEQPYESPDVDAWLSSRLPAQATPIIVSWQPDLALLTDSELFVRHWKSFCYPASDDTSVWPLDESWVFHFWHEEVFYFARRRPVA